MCIGIIISMYQSEITETHLSTSFSFMDYFVWYKEYENKREKAER